MKQSNPNQRIYLSLNTGTFEILRGGMLHSFEDTISFADGTSDDERKKAEEYFRDNWKVIISHREPEANHIGWERFIVDIFTVKYRFWAAEPNTYRRIR